MRFIRTLCTAASPTSPGDGVQGIELRDRKIIGTGGYSPLDAAGFVTSTLLDLSDAQAAPGFTVLNFNKMFGFSNFGVLTIRNDSACIFQSRCYFGRRKVDAVVLS